MAVLHYMVFTTINVNVNNVVYLLSAIPNSAVFTTINVSVDNAVVGYRMPSLTILQTADFVTLVIIAGQSMRKVAEEFLP